MSARDRYTKAVEAFNSGDVKGFAALYAADWAELSNLPGIGETLAREIVADRQAHGPFRSLDELTRVRGIGPHRLKEIRDFLNVGE